jgi:hypothetical protein
MVTTDFDTVCIPIAAPSGADPDMLKAIVMRVVDR